MSESLSADESGQLATVLAELTAADLPLSAGLRAAAEESTSRRLARALRHVAGQLEQGRKLVEVLEDPRQPLPPHVAGLLVAGLKSSRVGTALTELFEQQRAAYELRRSAWGAMLYPFILICLVLGIYALFSVFVFREFQTMFDEFQLRLEPWVKAMLWAGTVGIWLVIGALAAGMVLLLLARLVLGAARWQHIMSTAPLFGPIWHWSGVAEAARLLALLVDQNVPLPTALTLTAGGVRNRDVGQACRHLAVEIESGRSLADAVAAGTRLPPLFAPLMRVGEAGGALSSALMAAGEVYENRARRRIEVLRIVLPPLVFVLTGASIAFIVVGLFTPLVSLIVGLSM